MKGGEMSAITASSNTTQLKETMDRLRDSLFPLSSAGCGKIHAELFWNRPSVAEKVVQIYKRCAEDIGTAGRLMSEAYGSESHLTRDWEGTKLLYQQVLDQLDAGRPVDQLRQGIKTVGIRIAAAVLNIHAEEMMANPEPSFARWGNCSIPRLIPPKDAELFLPIFSMRMESDPDEPNRDSPDAGAAASSELLRSGWGPPVHFIHKRGLQDEERELAKAIALSLLPPERPAEVGAAAGASPVAPRNGKRAAEGQD